MIFLTFAMLPLAQAKHTLQDLERLHKVGAYREFFRHVSDVAPSERTQRWNKLVQLMSEGLYQDLIGRYALSQRDLELEQRVFELPEVRQNEVVRSLRAQFVVRQFRNCKRTSNPLESCLDALAKLAQYDTKHIEMSSLILGELASSTEKWPSTSREFQLIAQGLKSDWGSIHCKKPRLHEWLTNYLKRWPKTNLKTGLSEQCYSQLKLYLLQQSKQTNSLELAKLLLQSFQLKPLERAYQHMIVLLGKSSPGKLYNQAWRELESLSKAPATRQALADEFDKLSYLPGGAFKGRHAHIFAKHLKLHFPEYVRMYIAKCVDYKTGSRSFPAGNPTVDCEELYKRAPKVWPRVHRERYSQVLGHLKGASTQRTPNAQ